MDLFLINLFFHPHLQVSNISNLTSPLYLSIAQLTHAYMPLWYTYTAALGFLAFEYGRGLTDDGDEEEDEAAPLL